MLTIFPEHLKYTAEHEWVRDDGDVFVVGITDHAAELLGDITYAELPEVGLVLHQGEEVATVESVKAASDVYAPVDGRVVAVNEALVDEPGLINQRPYEAWFFKLEDVSTAQVDALMDATAYKRYVAENV